MRPRKRGKSLAGRSSQFRDATCQTAAEINDPDRQREQVLDPMVHLAEQQVLPLLGAFALNDVRGNLGRANYFSRRISDRLNSQ